MLRRIFLSFLLRRIRSTIICMFFSCVGYLAKGVSLFYRICINQHDFLFFHFRVIMKHQFGCDISITFYH
eukprot:UN01123